MEMKDILGRLEQIERDVAGSVDIDAEALIDHAADCDETECALHPVIEAELQEVADAVEDRLLAGLRSLKLDIEIALRREGVELVHV